MRGRSILYSGRSLDAGDGAAFGGRGKLARDLQGNKSSDQVNAMAVQDANSNVLVANGASVISGQWMLWGTAAMVAASSI
jgi:hypothetical protein